MEKPKSKQQLLMQSAWREAWKRGEVMMAFPNKSSAIRARMALYNAVKLEKQGIGDDLELIDAAQGVEVAWDKEVGLVMRRLDQAGFIQGIENGIGQTLEGQVDPAMVRAQERMMERLNASAIPKELQVELPEFMRR